MDWRPGYREVPPPAALRESVSCLWVAVVPPGQQRSTVVLPDACVDLIWEQGTGVYVAGPDTGPSPATSPPDTVMAAVRFAPGAAGAALRMPMSELLNRRVDAGLLGREPGQSLARLLPESMSRDEALATLIKLAGLLTTDRPADPLVAETARLLRDGPVQAERVAADLAVSERQLRRRCQSAVGYGPATLRRVLRFRRFVSWADAGAPGGLADAAVRFGYADQAHLTRECVQLAGLTPAALVAERTTPAPPAQT